MTPRRLPMEKAHKPRKAPVPLYLPPDVPRLPLSGSQDPKLRRTRPAQPRAIPSLPDVGATEELDPMMSSLGFARLVAPPRSHDDPLGSGWRVREMRASTHNTLRSLIAERRETRSAEDAGDPLGSGWARTSSEEWAARLEPEPELTRTAPPVPIQDARSPEPPLAEVLKALSPSGRERRRNMCTKCGTRLSPPGPGESTEDRVCEACSYFEQWISERYPDAGPTQPRRLWEMRVAGREPVTPAPQGPVERLLSERGFSSVFSLAGTLAPRPSLDDSLQEAPIERSRKVQLIHRFTTDESARPVLVRLLADNQALHSRVLETVTPRLQDLPASEALQVYREAEDPQTLMKLEYLIYRELGDALDEEVRSRSELLRTNWESFSQETARWIEDNRALLSSEAGGPCENVMAEVLGLYLLDGLNYTSYLEGNVPRSIRQVLDVLVCDGLLASLLEDCERAVRRLTGG